MLFYTFYGCPKETYAIRATTEKMAMADSARQRSLRRIKTPFECKPRSRHYEALAPRRHLQPTVWGSRLQIECVLSQTGAQETARAVSSSAQHGAVRQPHHSGGNGEEGPMSRKRQGPQWSSTRGSQREEQLGLESNMGELIGNDGPAEDLQALAIRSRFKRAIIDFPNQFSAGQHG